MKKLLLLAAVLSLTLVACTQYAVYKEKIVTIGPDGKKTETYSESIYQTVPTGDTIHLKHQELYD